MRKAAAATVTVAAAMLLAGCGLDGPIVDTRTRDGKYEVLVKDKVTDGPDELKWTVVPDGDKDQCKVGDLYPDCTKD